MPLEHESGVGLWLTHWILTSLGGKILFEVDDGTVVTVRLNADSSTSATEQC
jgi:sensor histidine kinase regulating citrate/malate metabolism